MIETQGLTRRFGEFVLGPISVRVEPGEYGIILGPSGSGKSLFLHTVAGIHAVDAGCLHLGGREMTAAPPERRRVGLVFQHSALFPHQSVIDNLGYGLKARGCPATETRRRVDAMVGRLGLEGLLSRPVASLSGGEAQKVAIGRALVAEPEVLLLDEPLGPIDYNGRLVLQQELARIHRELKITILHVTHSREEARALGDRCAIMLAGRIVQCDRMETLLMRPACAFVAGFLGVDGAMQGDPEGCVRGCFARLGRCDIDAPAVHDTRGTH